MLTTNQLLKIGMFAPGVLVSDVLIAQAMFPGFDAGSQFISELGGPKAPFPLIFNIGMVVGGVAGMFAGGGFAHALEAAGGRRIVSAFAGLWVALTGLGAVFGGLFHWPDPMHRACGVGLAIQFAPLFAAWALWRRPGYGLLTALSIVWFCGLLLVLALLIGVWNVRTGSDVGLWQRAHAFLGILWLGIAAWALHRQAASPHPPGVRLEPSPYTPSSGTL